MTPPTRNNSSTALKVRFLTSGSTLNETVELITQLTHEANQIEKSLEITKKTIEFKNSILKQKYEGIKIAHNKFLSSSVYSDSNNSSN